MADGDFSHKPMIQRCIDDAIQKDPIGMQVLIEMQINALPIGNRNATGLINRFVGIFTKGRSGAHPIGPHGHGFFQPSA